MNVNDMYFKNISARERAIFEGAITMGALFHQFIGTPISLENVDSIERSMESAMELQPCIKKVEVKINQEIVEDMKTEYNYLSLTGEMMDVKVVSAYKDKKAVIRMKYIKELKYPLMYVEDAD